MKHWILTGTIDPSKLNGVVVSGRFGSSVMDVAYSPWGRQWYWVYPKGQERIAEPEMIYVDEEWARANRNLEKMPFKRENPLDIRRRKAEQLMLF